MKFPFKIIFILVFFTSCIEYLYFDKAPKSNREWVKKEIKKWKAMEGVYQLNIEQFKIFKDVFKSNQFKNYRPPKLKKTTKDTLDYFGSVIFINRYLEIKRNKDGLSFLGFNCVNRNLFERFFKTKTRVIVDEKDSSSFTVNYHNDSIAIRFFSYSKNEKTSQDTLWKVKYWYRGDLLCYSGSGINVLDNSVHLNTKRNSDFNYLTYLQGKLYYVKKDTADKKVKFLVRQLKLDTNRFTLTALNQGNSIDSILNTFGLVNNDGIIKYKESQLSALFKSPLAIEEIVGQKIEGFEGISEGWNFKFVLLKYWFLFAILLGILFLFVVLKKYMNKKVHQ